MTDSGKQQITSQSRLGVVSAFDPLREKLRLGTHRFNVNWLIQYSKNLCGILSIFTH